MQLSLNPDLLEAGLDEAGRGSLMGRLYVGAVAFAPGTQLDPKLVKDSKKFSSRKRRREARDYVLDKCLAYGIAYAEPWEIDTMGLSRSLSKAMHRAVDEMGVVPERILVDGTYFEPYFHPYNPGFQQIPHQCVVDGDATYYTVAAGSILAKVAHDEHIEQLVADNPILREYGIDRNMGYGARQHIEAIDRLGLTEFHRKSFRLKKADSGPQDDCSSDESGLISECLL